MGSAWSTVSTARRTCTRSWASARRSRWTRLGGRSWGGARSVIPSESRTVVTQEWDGGSGRWVRLHLYEGQLTAWLVVERALLPCSASARGKGPSAVLLLRSPAVIGSLHEPRRALPPSDLRLEVVWLGSLGRAEVAPTLSEYLIAFDSFAPVLSRVRRVPSPHLDTHELPLTVLPSAVNFPTTLQQLPHSSDSHTPTKPSASPEAGDFTTLGEGEVTILVRPGRLWCRDRRN